MTEYELRKNFLEVTIRNENKKIVGKVSINLFLITTGPFHQDFELVFANGKIGRISFDLIYLFVGSRIFSGAFCYPVPRTVLI